MIRRLRDRHRRLILALALLTGLALVWALLAHPRASSVAPAGRSITEPPSRGVAEPRT